MWGGKVVQGEAYRRVGGSRRMEEGNCMKFCNGICVHEPEELVIGGGGGGKQWLPCECAGGPIDLEGHGWDTEV